MRYKLLLAIVFSFLQISLNSYSENLDYLFLSNESWLKIDNTCNEKLPEKIKDFTFDESYCENNINECLYECKNDNISSCYNLAQYLEKDEFTKFSEYKIGLYLKSCELGSASGCTNYAASISKKLGEKYDLCTSKIFKKSCELDDPWGCTMYGLHLFQGLGIKKDLNESIKFLNKACEKDKNDPACNQAIKIKEIVKNELINKKESNNVDEINFKGLKYLDNYQYDLAIEEFSKAIDLDQNNLEFYKNRGKAYYLKANYEIEKRYTGTFKQKEMENIFGIFNLAEKDFKKVLSKNTSNVELINNLALINLRSSNFIEKFTLLELNKVKKVDNLIEQIKISKNNYDYLKSNPKLYEFAKGMIKFSEDFLEEAKKLLIKAKSLKPDNHETYNNLALYYLSKENYKEAFKNIDKAININPKNYKYYNTKSKVSIIYGDYILAEKNIKKSISINKKISESNRLRALIYWLKKDYNLASKYYNLLIKEFNNDNLNKKIYEAFITSYISKYSKKSEVFLEKSMKDQRINKLISIILVDVYKTIGSKNFLFGNNEKAIEYFEKSLKLKHKKQTELFLTLALAKQANSYNKDKKHDQAIKIYKRILKIYPNDKSGYSVSLAFTYKKKKEYKKAIDIFADKVDRNKGFAPNFYNLATLYSLDNQEKKALINLKKAIDLDNKNKEKANSDKDFDNIRNNTESQNLTK